MAEWGWVNRNFYFVPWHVRGGWGLWQCRKILRVCFVTWAGGGENVTHVLGEKNATHVLGALVYAYKKGGGCLISTEV